MALPSGTQLNDRYTLRHSLRDAEAFSVTYLAFDEKEQEEVVITEYYPSHLAERASDEQTVRAVEEKAFRQGMKYFRKEAKVLSEIDHPNLARGIEHFEAFGTAYRVDEHRPGASLATALEKNDGSISERAALTAMKPVLGALHALHRKGLLHGGLSPEAIYLTKSRRVLLRNFRSAQLQLARKTGALDRVVTPGLSPAEQYNAEGRQGPWTDVYAAAATLYRAVTGQTLPEAREPVPESVITEHLERAEELSEDIKRIIKRALAPRPRGRLQSAQALQELLEDPAKVLDEEPAASDAAKAGHSEADSWEADPSEADPSEAESAGDEASSEENDLGAWGPASLAAAAAEAAKKDKEKARERRKAEQAERDRAQAAEEATAREDRSARSAGSGEGDDKRMLPVSNRVAMGGGALLVIVLLAGAGFLFTDLLGVGPSNAESSADARYERLVSQGDSLYEQSNYQAAASRYEKAKELDAEGGSANDHITERLLVIDRLRDAISQENYRRAMSQGDSLMARAQRMAEDDELGPQATLLYEQAREAFLTALDSRQGDSLALARTQRVRGVLLADSANAEQNRETSLEEERQRLFERYRDQGDEAFENEDYETARRKFREALDYQPGNTYVSDKLDEISSRISESQRRRQYQRYRQRADSLFAAGQLEEARREYQLALDVKPGDSVAASRVSTIDQRFAQRRQNQQQYQYHRGRGDVFFDEGNLEEAAQSYKQALEYRPEDDYVQGRLEQVKQKVAAAEKARKEKARERANRTENGIYKVTDEQPTIAGGIRTFYEKISYPTRARRQGIEGRVYLRVTVGADGSVQNVEVLRGIGYGADEEAVQAARQTKFEPATVDGKPVPAYRTLMAEFKIQRDE